MSSRTFPLLFLNSNVIVLAASAYITADFITQAFNASKIWCWSPLKYPPLANELSNSAPYAKVVFAVGSKFGEFGLVQPRTGAIHEPSSKQAVES